MPNKTTRKISFNPTRSKPKQKKASAPVKHVKETPMIHSPRYKQWGAIGREIGSKFGFGVAGRALGQAISKISGHGDYNTSEFPVENNLLVNKSEVPQFSGSKTSNIVCHREYISDITTSASPNTFSLSSLSINPGQNGTFPWLATIAQCYEEYRIHGMVFEFKSTSSDALNSTNTALGEVILATNYNASSTNFSNKLAMENSEFAQSAKPSLSQAHAVECKPQQNPLGIYYVRTGSLPSGQDIRFYDMGNFQIATNGFQGTSVNVGELWCTYMIEFLKPILPLTAGGNMSSFHTTRSAVAAATYPLGTTIKSSSGSMTTIVTGTVLTVYADVGNVYNVKLIWQGTSAVCVTPMVANTGCTGMYLFANGISYDNGYYQTNTGTTTCCLFYDSYWTCTAPVMTFTFGVAGTIPTGTAAVDIFVNGLDSTVIS